MGEVAALTVERSAEGGVKRVRDGDVKTRSVPGAHWTANALQGWRVVWEAGFSALSAVRFSDTVKVITDYKSVIQIYDTVFKCNLHRNHFIKHNL